MDFDLTDEQKEFVALVREVLEKQIELLSAKLSEEGIYASKFIGALEEKLKLLVKVLPEESSYPSDFLKKIGSLGFMGIFIPEEYGGLGKSIFEFSLVAEEIARVCLSAATAYGAVALGTLPILLSGTEDQKKKY